MTDDDKEQLERIKADFEGRKTLCLIQGFMPLPLHRDIDFLIAKLDEAHGALRFYAKGNHFEFDGPNTECEKESEPETVSGEPTNWLCGHGDFTFEDGFVAREALGEKNDRRR